VKICSLPMGLVFKLLNRNAEELENFSINMLNELQAEDLHDQYTKT